MTFNERISKKEYDRIWQEYCGFLDISLKEYMEIQERLLLEQIELYSECELGKRIMQGKRPTTLEEFRAQVPLTTYEDYADILLQKSNDFLPADAALWIETTWQGGKNPIKVAPYTRAMIEGHLGNCMACVILATSDKRGSFTLDRGDNFLYGLAPLPYLTGIVPYLLEGEVDVNFLPPTKEAEKMSFGKRNKLGFKMGMRQGIDLFFGLSSVISRISEEFAEGHSSGGAGYNPFLTKPNMSYRIIKAWLRHKLLGEKLLPKNIFKLKGLGCAGTDSAYFKDKIEYYWGVRPMEIFGGTEATWIATETWSKDGLVFFPDVCLYEFIPEDEMERSLDDPSYQPNTYLMNELEEGRNYEIVITTFKGGAFARYRIGDVFRCLSLYNQADGIDYPQFAYIDRVPTTIDISGFTRITEATITRAIEISKLEVGDWVAVKEYDPENRTYMHLYLESDARGEVGLLTAEIVKEHLSIYFRFVDNDYTDLKRFLGIDPLVITVIPCGTIEKCSFQMGHKIRRINPPHADMTAIHRAIRSKEGVES